MPVFQLEHNGQSYECRDLTTSEMHEAVTLSGLHRAAFIAGTAMGYSRLIFATQLIGDVPDKPAESAEQYAHRMLRGDVGRLSVETVHLIADAVLDRIAPR